MQFSIQSLDFSVPKGRPEIFQEMRICWGIIYIHRVLSISIRGAHSLEERKTEIIKSCHYFFQYSWFCCSHLICSPKYLDLLSPKITINVLGDYQGVLIGNLSLLLWEHRFWINVMLTSASIFSSTSTFWAGLSLGSCTQSGTVGFEYYSTKSQRLTEMGSRAFWGTQ